MTLRISRATLNPRRKGLLESIGIKYVPYLFAYGFNSLVIAGLFIPDIVFFKIISVRFCSSILLTIAFAPVWLVFLRLTALRGDDATEFICLLREVFCGRSFSPGRNVKFRYFLSDYARRNTNGSAGYFSEDTGAL